MLHIDLFSGIGGFSYAIDQVWRNVDHIFCDIDPFARAVTKKHWKGSIHYENIRQLIADTAHAKQKRIRSKTWKTISKISECDIVTGGFPCQPFSQAGRRMGTNDDRYLWPEMFEVIRNTKPEWVVAENVRGLVTWNEGMVLEQVCTDMEAESYEVQPFIIPAVSKNAPHRRDRVWIVANKQRKGLERIGEKTERHSRLSNREGSDKKQNSNVENSISKRSGGRMENNRQILESEISKIKNEGSGWEKNWVEVAAKLCRVDDGVSARVDGLELTKSAHRRERLKSLGNAIVPQVAIEIMKGIKKYENRS